MYKWIFTVPLYVFAKKSGNKVYGYLQKHRKISLLIQWDTKKDKWMHYKIVLTNIVESLKYNINWEKQGTKEYI